MMHFARRALPVLAAALLTMDAAAQGRVVRLPERDRPLAGQAPQAFAIGTAEGREHEMFGEVTAVAFDRADNLYVLDRQSARVMVYDRTGRFVRQIGKKGQGPGELSVPMQLAIGGDGTVIVADLARRGYALFRPDGTFLRQVSADDGVPARNGMAWHPRGGMVGTLRPSMRDPGGSGTRTENTLPLVYQPLAGGAPVRLFNVPQQWTITQSSSGTASSQRREVRVSGPPTYSPRVLMGVLPGGQIALSFTSGYTVRILDANGQTLRYLQRPMRTRLTTERDRERARDETRESMRSGRGRIVISTGGGPAPVPAGPSQAEIEREVAQMRFSDTIPALQGLRVAPSGKLWIERTAPNVDDPGPVDLVTPEGQYLGTITAVGLPDAISAGGLAAYIETDDLDVQRVVVRRLPAAWR